LRGAATCRVMRYTPRRRRCGCGKRGWRDEGRSLTQYIIKRLVIAIPVLLGISVLAFCLVRAVPGDTVTVLLGTHYTEEQAVALRQRLGLDKPLWTQYFIWLGRVLQGDFGESAYTGRPV